MEPADLIWMNGEFVAWEDAKVHVLTHGLHYGTGRLRGRPLLRHRDRPGGLPPRRPHRPALQVGRALLHADPVRPRAAPPGDARAHRPQRPALLLHPPARLPRLRHDGPVPARRAGRRRDRRLGVGRATSARRARRNGVRAKVSSLAAHQPRLADPARQGHRASTSTRSWPRSSRTRPATRRRSSSTTTATSARARARTSSSCATA